MPEKNLKNGKKSKEEIKDLKKRMVKASDEITKILTKYKFNTVQAAMVLQQTSRAIREAQAERSVSD